MPLDLEPIRALLIESDAEAVELTPRDAVFDYEWPGSYSQLGHGAALVSGPEGTVPPLAFFMANAPAYVAALLAEVERLRSELTGLRRYLTRSIATGIGGQDEPAEILAALSNEDAALIDRWTAAMENPAYAASDAARLRKDVWDLSESNVSLDRNLKDCVAWMSALEPVIGADLNALRLEPDRAAAVETVRQAVRPEPRFIVRLEPGVWIAGWNGDPGRTTVKASAKRFPTERSARRALSKARRCREFPLAAVECVP